MLFGSCQYLPSLLLTNSGKGSASESQPVMARKARRARDLFAKLFRHCIDWNITNVIFRVSFESIFSAGDIRNMGYTKNENILFWLL